MGWKFVPRDVKGGRRTRIWRPEFWKLIQPTYNYKFGWIWLRALNLIFSPFTERGSAWCLMDVNSCKTPTCNSPHLGRDWTWPSDSSCTHVIISLRGSASDIFRILWTSIWNCWQAPTSWLGTTLWLGSPPQGRARCISTSCLWCVALDLLWGLKILHSTKKSCIHTMQVFLLLLIKVDITMDIENNSNAFTKLILNWCFHWPVHYAARAMGAMSLRISELCLSFSPHPNISDRNFNLVHHFFRIQIFQINEKGSSWAWIRWRRRREWK